ncbi:CSLREA domain-containing protein, partial [bacterium]|nr:CSLREA domain-containing protein [bacterium]
MRFQQNAPTLFARISMLALLLGLVSALLGGTWQEAAAQSAPQPPHTFFGAVSLDGAPVVDGTSIQVEVTHSITETHTLNTVVFSNGGQNSLYLIQIPADDPTTPIYDGGLAGDTIVFKLGDASVAAALTFTWGENTEQNLVFLSPTPTPTATPTETPTATATATPTATPTATQVVNLSIVVNTTNDVVANDGFCSLREAITAANTDTSSGATSGECAAGSNASVDVISFSIPGAGPYTISLTSALPTIANPVTIDGGAQAITIDATSLANTLQLLAPNSTLRNLTLANFNGIGLVLNNADGATLENLNLSKASACTFSGSGIGLNATNSDNLVIRNVSVRNRGTGMNINTGDNVLIEQSDFAGAGCANATSALVVNSITNLR